MKRSASLMIRPAPYGPAAPTRSVRADIARELADAIARGDTETEERATRVLRAFDACAAIEGSALQPPERN